VNPLSSLNSILPIIAIVLTLGYAWSCGAFPYKACRSCRGRGIFRSSILGAIRDCRRCDGSGRVLRVGRRAYNAWSRTRRAMRADRQRDQRERDRRDDNR
jgi:hypothetical protein